MEWVDTWKKQEVAVSVVDRIEGEKTVILLEERREELIIETAKINLLAREDDWFLISLKEDEAVLLKALPTVTSEQKNRSKELVEQVREKE